MSSTLRLSIIAFMLLATAALGLIAFTMNRPQATPAVQVTENAPAPLPVVRYLVAARELPRGTFARDEDFGVAGNGKVRLDEHAPGPVERRAERAAERRARHAGRPDDGPRFETIPEQF